MKIKPGQLWKTTVPFEKKNLYIIVVEKGIQSTGEVNIKTRSLNFWLCSLIETWTAAPGERETRCTVKSKLIELDETAFAEFYELIHCLDNLGFYAPDEEAS